MDSNVKTRILRSLTQPTAVQVERSVRRASTQLDFARELRPEAVAEAEAIFEAGPTGYEDLSNWVSRIEAALAPLAEEAKSYTIHSVGHGHIDMNWMWSWPETVSATHDTFASVLSFMDQYPEFTYSQSQASVYALIEKYHPEMFERIRERVKEGRWEVAAAHWVEGDKNIASGESLARHLLFTRAYFQEKFDLTPEDCPVDWEPDTFGHANTIPGILKQGGVKYYYSCRTGGGHGHPRHGDERPPIFWWQGPDGSRVLVNRETTWYNSYVNIGENFAIPMLKFCRETGLSDWLNVYGVGNHGGGPTRVEIDYFIETQSWPIWPTVRFSTSKAYFEKIERTISEKSLDIPVIDHELNFEFTGCYTSQSAIKRANRFGENFCVEAETLLAITKPESEASEESARLREAWLNVLFNQFHDILPGSGVAATREHALGLYQEVGAITGAVKRNALQSIAKKLDTAALLPATPEAEAERARLEAGSVNDPFVAGVGQGAGDTGLSIGSGGGRMFRPFLVYNPCAWSRTEMVEVSLYDWDGDPDRIVALDETGRAHPTLVTYRSENIWANWGHRKLTLIFPATDVPSLGYKTFLFTEGDPDPSLSNVTLKEFETFETPHLKVQLDRYSGGIKQLETNGVGLGIVDSDFGAWWKVVERPRGMTSWVLGDTRDEESVPSSSFSVEGASRNEGTSAPFGWRAAYVATRDLKVPGTESTVKLKTMIHGLSPRIDFTAEVDWREIGTWEKGIPGLYVQFFGDDGAHRFESPFGSVVRDDFDHEVPTLRYAHLGSTVTVLQDSKYGHHSAGNDLKMRVVRSSFDPDHAPEVGKSTVRYSVVFHQTAPSTAELTRLGAAWNHPLIVTSVPLQNGTEPTRKELARVAEGDVVLSSLKRAQDGNGLIARLVNYSETDVETEVHLAPEMTRNLSRVQAVDLLERSCSGTAQIHASGFRVTVPANSFASVRLN